MLGFMGSVTEGRKARLIGRTLLVSRAASSRDAGLHRGEEGAV